MPTQKDDLLQYLNEAREAMLWKLAGLDEYGARRPTTPTGTNLLGLIKHLTSGELTYFARTFDRPSPDLGYLETFDAWENEDMWARADEPRQEIVDRYRRACTHSDGIIAELPLDATGRVPHWPVERAETTLHHVIVRMIGETHRHAGQADIVREHLDRTVGYRAGGDSLPSDDRAWWEQHVKQVESAARQAAGQVPVRRTSTVRGQAQPEQNSAVVAVAQINIIVAELERSRAFYERLGVTFRGRSRTGDGPAEAWVSTNTGITMVLHSTGFASWWDDTGPQPSAGGSQVDLEFESVERLNDVVSDLDTAGATTVKPPTDMPWGQRFAIVRDPDGYRVGLKAPLDGGGA